MNRATTVPFRNFYRIRDSGNPEGMDYHLDLPEHYVLKGKGHRKERTDHGIIHVSVGNDNYYKINHL